jgi:microsomal dipeptidase-like Zn-dependent dipeptidase
MNTLIELHDSKVTEIGERNGMVSVHFLPAYLHKSEGRPELDHGTGWVQEARLIFAGAAASGDFPGLPCDVMDGELVIGAERHDNEIPVPLAVTAHTELRLVFDSIHTVRVTGRGVRLEL